MQKIKQENSRKGANKHTGYFLTCSVKSSAGELKWQPAALGSWYAVLSTKIHVLFSDTGNSFKAHDK